MDVLGKILEFETGELSQQECLELFAELVRTGLVWQLQGSYGRTAASLIDQGFLDNQGNILKSFKVAA